MPETIPQVVDGADIGIACSRYIGTPGRDERLCPEAAVEDVTASIDRRRYSIPLCTLHTQEHKDRMAARRRRGTPMQVTA